MNILEYIDGSQFHEELYKECLGETQNVEIVEEQKINDDEYVLMRYLGFTILIKKSDDELYFEFFDGEHTPQIPSILFHQEFLFDFFHNTCSAIEGSIDQTKVERNCGIVADFNDSSRTMKLSFINTQDESENVDLFIHESKYVDFLKCIFMYFVMSGVLFPELFI